MNKLRRALVQFTLLATSCCWYSTNPISLLAQEEKQEFPKTYADYVEVKTKLATECREQPDLPLAERIARIQQIVTARKQCASTSGIRGQSICRASKTNPTPSFEFAKCHHRGHLSPLRFVPRLSGAVQLILRSKL